MLRRHNIWTRWEAFLVAGMEWGGGGTQCKGKMSWDKEYWVNNKEHNKSFSLTAEIADQHYVQQEES